MQVDRQQAARSDAQAFAVRPLPDPAQHGVALSGELDLASTHLLRRVLDELRGDGDLDVLVDLRALEFLDAAGLGLLALADREFREAGGSVVLIGLRDRHRRLLEITALDRVLTVESSILGP